MPTHPSTTLPPLLSSTSCQSRPSLAVVCTSSRCHVGLDSLLLSKYPTAATKCDRAPRKNDNCDPSQTLTPLIFTFFTLYALEEGEKNTPTKEEHKEKPPKQSLLVPPLYQRHFFLTPPPMYIPSLYRCPGETTGNAMW